MGKKSATNTAGRSAAEVKAEKKKAFKRVCTPRVNKALKAIGLVGLCASSNYESTVEESNAVCLALQSAVDDVKARFSGEKKATAGFQLPS